MVRRTLSCLCCAVAIAAVAASSASAAATKTPNERIVFDGSFGYVTTDQYAASGGSQLDGTATEMGAYKWHLVWKPDPADRLHLNFLLDQKNSKITGTASHNDAASPGSNCSGQITVSHLDLIRNLVPMTVKKTQRRVRIQVPMNQITTCFGSALSIGYASDFFDTNRTIDIGGLKNGQEVALNKSAPFHAESTTPASDTSLPRHIVSNGTLNWNWTYGPAFDYVALGDSFASGNGAGGKAASGGAGCHRSAGAYPLFYSKKAEFWACSGALIPDILTNSFAGEPPQIAHVTRSTRVVSISVGGNDAQLFRALKQCVTFGFTGGDCKDKLGIGADVEAHLAALPAQAASLFELLRLKAAPNAKIAVMGYPNPMPAKAPAKCDALAVEGSFGIARIPPQDVSWFHDLIDRVNAILKAQAKAQGVTYVAPFAGHDVCNVHPWFRPLSRKADALHPDATGNQRMAKLLRAAVGPPPN